MFRGVWEVYSHRWLKNATEEDITKGISKINEVLVYIDGKETNI